MHNTKQIQSKTKYKGTDENIHKQLHDGKRLMMRLSQSWANREEQTIHFGGKMISYQTDLLMMHGIPHENST